MSELGTRKHARKCRKSEYALLIAYLLDLLIMEIANFAIIECNSQIGDLVIWWNWLYDDFLIADSWMCV